MEHIFGIGFTQLQRPIEPFLVKELGADNVGYGHLQSFFSAVRYCVLTDG